MNLVTFLEKEINKGNTHISLTGELLTEDKLNAIVKKSYVAEARAGKIDVSEVSFADYAKKAKSVGNYKTTESVLEHVKNVFGLFSEKEQAVGQPDTAELATATN